LAHHQTFWRVRTADPIFSPGTVSPGAWHFSAQRNLDRTFCETSIPSLGRNLFSVTGRPLGRFMTRSAWEVSKGPTFSCPSSIMFPRDSAFSLPGTPPPAPGKGSCYQPPMHSSLQAAICLRLRFSLIGSFPLSQVFLKFLPRLPNVFFL